MKIKNNIYFLYTIFFVIMFFAVYYIFIKLRKSFIWSHDGFTQYYICLYYFNDIIREFIHNPSIGLPMFTWNMGTGVDIIGTFSCNMIGDIPSYISLFFPMKNMVQAYNFIVVIRMYLVGIAFLYYCRYHKREKIPSIVGAIVYVFSSYMLFASIRHPFFMNSIILFPILLVAVDKLLREDKKAFFVFWIFISAFVNYYFFYMNTILIAIYALVQYFCRGACPQLHGHLWTGAPTPLWKSFLKTTGLYIVGILMAGAVLLPAAHTFLNSARTSWEGIVTYDFDYYKQIIEGLISTRGIRWHYIGVASIILLMIPVLFANMKKNKAIIIYFLIMTAMVLIPGIDSVMNGFSAPSGRWTYAYAFILAYIITIGLNKKLEYSKKEIKYMFYGVNIYTISLILIHYFYQKLELNIFAFLFIAFIILIIIVLKDKVCKDRSLYLPFTTIVIAIILANIILLSQTRYRENQRNYVAEFVENDKVIDNYKTSNGKFPQFKEAIDYIKSNDKDFYRIEKTARIMYNISMLYRFNSLSLFVSVGSEYLNNLSKELECDNSNLLVHAINGLEDRTKITSLLGLKYFITDGSEKNIIPYGYEEYKSYNGTKICKNKNALSLGVSYDSYMLREEYEKLNPLEKEDVLLKTAVIEKEIDGYDLKKINDPKEILSQIKEVKYDVIENKEKSIKLLTDNIKNGEVYVYIKNLNFAPYSKKAETGYKITAELNGIKVNEEIKNISDTYYIKNSDILLNLGYCNDVEKEIKISFNSEKGYYSYDWIKVINVSMEEYENTINKLRLGELKNVEYNNRHIKGKVSLEKDSILQISTSYTKGWKAYVDGKKADTIIVNTAFIGIPVEAGEHKIYFKYETPYLKEGLILSVTRIYNIYYYICI